MNGLSDCPFCGSNDVKLLEGDDDGRRVFFVTCDDCDACGPLDTREDHAEQRWNKRT